MCLSKGRRPHETAAAAAASSSSRQQQQQQTQYGEMMRLDDNRHHHHFFKQSFHRSAPRQKHRQKQQQQQYRSRSRSRNYPLIPVIVMVSFLVVSSSLQQTILLTQTSLSPTVGGSYYYYCDAFTSTPLTTNNNNHNQRLISNIATTKTTNQHQPTSSYRSPLLLSPFSRNSNNRHRTRQYLLKPTDQSVINDVGKKNQNTIYGGGIGSTTSSASTTAATTKDDDDNTSSIEYHPENAPPFTVTLEGEDGEYSYGDAIQRTLGWVGAATIFGGALWAFFGSEIGEEFFAGYLIEQSLSVDNLFVFLLLFEYFKVPLQYQDRVLNWGIYGAIVMRAVMIGLGAAALQNFHAILLFFAAILVYSSGSFFVQEFMGGEDEEEDPGQNAIVKFSRSLINSVDYFDGDRFFTSIEDDGAITKFATPLFICMIAVEISDIVFAVDSIPAVFGVTEVRLCSLFLWLNECASIVSSSEGICLIGLAIAF